MIEERKSEEFETGNKKWKVYFDIADTFEKHSCIDVRFSLNRTSLTPEDINELKQDLKDLEKFRIIKQGKKFLE